MERFTISKSEKQTIYEIYRACRLCGAGGGYRMPIIQNIIDLDSSEVELRLKIQECLQLEVRPDDRMPPLICELCVDKVNDFYQFLELTRQTNVRTRTRLGLPLETAKKGESEPSDCILGVTEPVYVEDEPPAKKSKAGPKSKVKTEPEAVQIKVESPSGPSSRSSSLSSRSSRGAAPAPSAAPPAPAPAPPAPRGRRHPAPQQPEKPAPTQPDPTVSKEKKPRNKELQTLLQDNMKYDDNALLVPRSLKRTKEEPPRPALLPKRAKAAPKEPVKEPTPPPRSKPGPKSRKSAPATMVPETAAKETKAQEPPKQEKTPVPLKVYKAKKPQDTAKPAKERPAPPAPPSPPPPPPPPQQFKCVVCSAQLKNSSGYSSHMRVHPPTFTKPENACNPCGKWFTTAEEATVHHSYHRAATFPYHCRHCFGDYTTLRLYDEHIEKGLCSLGEERPDVACEECGKSFPTETLRSKHKCKPTGKCSHCSKTYATLKNLRKHETHCTQRRKRDLIADPDVLRRLKPMQVRILRCDGLLSRSTGDHYDVSTVKPTYGLAKNYVYPYLKLSPVKPEPLRKDSMVAIPVATHQCETDAYSHWDSDESCDTVIRRVPSLTTLAIKKLFSKNLLGKVPKKRKVKNETFDDNDFGNISSDISDIISSLGDDLGNVCLDRKVTDKIKDIIGCLDFEDVDDVSKTNDGVSETNDGVSKTNDGVNKTNDGVNKTNDGVNKTNDGVSKTNDGVNKTNDGVSNTNDGVNKTNDGISNTNDGISNTNDGISNKNDGSGDKSYSTNDNLEPNDDKEKVNDSNVDLSDSVRNESQISELDRLDDESENFNDGKRIDDITEMINERIGDNTDIENHSNVNENKADLEEIGSSNDNDTRIADYTEVKNHCNMNDDNGTDDLNTENNPNINDNNAIHDLKTIDDINNEIENHDLGTEIENQLNTNNDLRIIELDTESERRNDKEIDKLDNETENNVDIFDTRINVLGTESERHSNDKEIDKLDNETENNLDINNKIASLQNENEMAAEFEAETVNGNHENYSKTDDKQKESPIKHSIENLIGEDKNPDKYISEVISSIEDIIQKNNQNEQLNGDNEVVNDSEVNSEVNGEVKEKRLSDNDKITLDDLLPRDDRPSDLLDNISDDDFNFDA